MRIKQNQETIKRQTNLVIQDRRDFQIVMQVFAITTSPRISIWFRTGNTISIV